MPNHARALSLGVPFLPVVLACHTAVIGSPPRENLSAQQPALIRADSEVFETVVRLLLTGGEKDYPYKRDPLRVDSHPEAAPSPFDDVAGGQTGSATSAAESRPDSATLLVVSERRRVILKRIGVEEGGAYRYPKCHGTLMIQPRGAPPPPAGDCPDKPHNYAAISTPIKGVAVTIPERLRRQDLAAPDPRGEIWTVIVSEAYVGPGGQNWFEHAWILRRDPTDNRLKLALTVLLAWAE